MATNERLDLPRPTSALASLRARAAEAVRFHPRETAALAVLGLLVLSGAAVAYARARPVPAAALAPVEAPSGRADERGARIYVHVVGAVKDPGVYAFDEGARVIDAVRAAGGLRRGADAAGVNLARILVDGEQVVVPARGEATPASGPAPPPAPGAPTPSGALVNINQADAAGLDALPGIGPVIAERIVQYRDQHGPFRSVRDLMKVSGIGPKKFESLEASVTV